MKTNQWYFDPMAASKQQFSKKQQSSQEQNRSAAAAKTTTKTSAAAGSTTTTASSNSEILDLITAMNNVAQGKATAQSVSDILLTAKDGSADFLLGNSEQQSSWGICYALSSMDDIARNASASLSKLKNLFTITSKGEIQVTFAKNINGAAFTSAQISAGLNKETITAADLQYLYNNNLNTKSSESAGDVLSLAYGKMLLDLQAKKKVASTTAQAVTAADGAISANNAKTSDAFMNTLGVGKATYTNITSSLTDATLLQSIKDTIAKKGAVTATTKTSGTQLTPGHCYSIVGVDAKGNIILHNPWGIDGSTGNLKADSNTSDGLITMSMADFRANFSYTSQMLPS